MYNFYQNIPNFITLCNGICGMLAIIFAQQGNFILAIMCIAFGTLFDAFDGKIARLLGSSSELGGELDSLCDCVTFGIAPATLLLFQIEQTLNFLPIWGIVCAAVYLSCVIWRLARFNVETTTDVEDHKYFEGLPSPLGAGLVCSALWFIYFRDLTTHQATPYFLAGIAFVTGLLMVSRIRFVHLVTYTSEILSPRQFLGLIITSLLICISFHPISWSFCFPGFFLVSFAVTKFESAPLKEEEKTEEEKLKLA